MKMKTEHFNELKQLFQLAFDRVVSDENTIEDQIAQYERGDFTNADKTKDLSMRFRWDLFWCIPQPERKAFMDKIYTYLNDTHIDTAIKKIIPYNLKRKY